MAGSTSTWPMMRGSEVCGALVVQSYREGICYTTEDQALLAFVANHILTAIDNLPDEDAIVSAALAPGNDGTGVVTAMAKTYCSGGEGGLPLPPQTAPI